MDTSNFGFDPTQFTNAPLQTKGWIRFANPAGGSLSSLDSLTAKA